MAIFMKNGLINKNDFVSFLLKKTDFLFNTCQITDTDVLI